MWFNSEATFRPNNVASTEIIDRKTPNSEVCMANGYSSMVFDQRIFVSFNPCDIAIKALPTGCRVTRSCTVTEVLSLGASPGRFNVYVAQPEVKPGCVLRRSNVNVLESRKLVDNDQVPETRNIHMSVCLPVK